MPTVERICTARPPYKGIINKERWYKLTACREVTSRGWPLRALRGESSTDRPLTRPQCLNTGRPDTEERAPQNRGGRGPRRTTSDTGASGSERGTGEPESRAEPSRGSRSEAEGRRRGRRHGEGPPLLTSDHRQRKAAAILRDADTLHPLTRDHSGPMWSGCRTDRAGNVSGAVPCRPRWQRPAERRHRAGERLILLEAQAQRDEAAEPSRACRRWRGRRSGQGITFR